MEEEEETQIKFSNPWNDPSGEDPLADQAPMVDVRETGNSP